MRIHFIAIGGSAMHNLAIALHKKGYTISGSDDEIFEPSKSRLIKYGLLPEKEGWDVNNISEDIDAIILGMHAREDNPELNQAKNLGLKIYSYPEFLYEQSKNKIRVVIGGSHGKTTITSMVMHVLKFHNIEFDYMVGAQLEGFETMVELSEKSKIAIFEGDEYLSSPIDRRPKFHLYKPNIALISGIAWDHINVFPTFGIYKLQFERFLELIEPGGSLIYFEGDDHILSLLDKVRQDISKASYTDHQYITRNNGLVLLNNGSEFPVQIIGEHNLQNISGAKKVCHRLGLNDNKFYEAIITFKGAAKRLQLLAENDHSKFYFDFAHSPSKLKATIDAVKFQYPYKKILAIMELHTFSSLNKSFLSEYKDSMNSADESWVYYSPKTIEHKRLEPISKDEIKNAFNNSFIKVFDDSETLISKLTEKQIDNTVILVMTSGNFSGVDINHISEKLMN